MADKFKFVAALLLPAAGIAGFYLLGEQPMIVRVLCVLAGLGASVSVAWFTEPGQRFFVFGKEAAAETKKVVWPTRRETLQTTGAVFGFVVLMALFLWVADKGLEWLLYDVVLGWKKS